MAYTDVFGGELIFPSRISYLALTIAADVVLQWPTEQQITGNNVVADFIDVNATAASLNIDMPSALNTATGNKTTFNNVGANAVNVRTSTGATIQVVQPGEQWVLVLTDNSTAAGSWSTFQLGAQVAVASASALAGAGIKAIGVLLNQKIDSDVKAATPVTVVNGDRAKCLIYTGGAGIANLPAAGTVGNDWFFMLRNSGTGTLTITPPAGTIDGSATVNLDPNDSAFIFTDGSNFFTIGLSSGSTIAFDFVSIPVPGSGDFVLSGANLNRIAYRFTGALTGNRRIVVPNTTQQYWVDNQTSGAFTLSISTVAQVTPPEVSQGNTAILYSDATDVVNATSQTSIVFPVTVAQGGTSATTAAGARTNLNAAFDGRVLTAGAGIGGGGDLTADRTFTLNINSANTTPVPAAGDFVAFEDIDDNLTYKATIQAIVDAADTTITIEDEGAPLATGANTLDFVGAGVVASGAGSTKTITISGAAVTPIILLDNEQIRFGTGNDVQFQYNGTVMEILGGQDIFVDSNAAQANSFVMLNSVRGIALEIEASGNARINNVSSLGVFQGTYIDMDQATGRVLLNFGNVPVARSAAVSGGSYPYTGTAGGLLVNNNETGQGADERVLTFSDHGMTGASATQVQNLTTTIIADTRLVNGVALREGYYKFEIFVGFDRGGGTSDVKFDFNGTNLTECQYIYDYRSADGTPSGSGASDDAGTDQTVTLGAVNEKVYVRITGSFRISTNSGTFEFRWAPTVSQIDSVTR